jgi:hypothetical protein
MMAYGYFSYIAGIITQQNEHFSKRRTVNREFREFAVKSIYGFSGLNFPPF